MQGCGRTSPGGTGIYFCRVPSKTELKFPGGSFGITEKNTEFKSFKIPKFLIQS